MPYRRQTGSLAVAAVGARGMDGTTKDTVLQCQVARGVGIYLATGPHECSNLGIRIRGGNGGGEVAVLDGNSLSSTNQSASVGTRVLDGARDSEVLEGRPLHVAEETIRISARIIEVDVDGMTLPVERAAEGFALAGRCCNGCYACRYLFGGRNIGSQRHRLARVVLAAGLDGNGKGIPVRSRADGGQGGHGHAAERVVYQRTAVGHILPLAVNVDSIHFYVVNAGILDGDATLKAWLTATRQVVCRNHVRPVVSSAQSLVCVLILTRWIGIDIYLHTEAPVTFVGVVSPTTHIDVVCLTAANVQACNGFFPCPCRRSGYEHDAQHHGCAPDIISENMKPAVHLAIKSCHYGCCFMLMFRG